jgi:hypothetical protein
MQGKFSGQGDNSYAMILYHRTDRERAKNIVDGGFGVA